MFLNSNYVAKMWNLSDCPILHQASEIRPTKTAESAEDSTAVDMPGKASKYLLDVKNRFFQCTFIVSVVLLGMEAWTLTFLNLLHSPSSC